MAGKNETTSWTVDKEHVRQVADSERCTLTDIEAAPFVLEKDGKQSTGHKFIANMKCPESGKFVEVTWVVFDASSRTRRW